MTTGAAAMFKPLSLHDPPLKEGRLPLAVPHSPRDWSSKRSQRVRNMVLGVVILLVFKTVTVLYWAPSAYDLPARPTETALVPSRPRPTPTNHATTKFPTLDVGGVKENEADPDAPVLPLSESGQPGQPGQVPLAGAGHDGGLIKIGTTASENKFSTRPEFDQALLKVINLLPSELETRSLLRPTDLTGEKRLREFGLLVRKYRKYLEAWEELHTATDPDGSTYIRDDVIQYLRRKASTATVKADHDDLIGKIHGYEEFRHLLTQVNDLLFPYTAPYFSDHMSIRSHLKKGGRGIALTAGNDQVAYLLTQIPILRKLGCDLPIEVMYVGDNDLNRDSRQDLEDLEGVITRDIGAMIKPEGWNVASWAAKPFAILLSSFREVLFIDADSFFFVNPEVMFDYPEYVKTGAMFFRDRLIMPETKKAWLQSVLPQPVSKNVKQSRLWKGESGHQQESGVMLVDTYRHFMAMLAVTRMNGPDSHGDRERGKVGVYDMVYGDKETFWLGFELVGDTDYVFHQGDAGVIGVLEPPPEGKEKKTKKQKRQEPDEEAATPEKPSPTNSPSAPSTPSAPSAPNLPEPEVEDEGYGFDSVGLPKHKMCAPQLLHLDTQGKPLWFNGGLVQNKFLDRRQWKFNTWSTYLIEPRDIREPGAWRLGEANMACLITDNHLIGQLTVKEMELLEAMKDQARTAGIAN